MRQWLLWNNSAFFFFFWTYICLPLVLAFFCPSAAFFDHPECLSPFLHSSSWNVFPCFRAEFLLSPFLTEDVLISLLFGCCPWAVFPWVPRPHFTVQGLESVWDSSCGQTSCLGRVILMKTAWARPSDALGLRIQLCHTLALGPVCHILIFESWVYPSC